MNKIIALILLLTLTVSLYADKIFFAKGHSDSKEVSLSFDDGPGLSTTEILKILEEKEVTATFFLLGTSIVKNPKLVKEIYSKGYEIANHTYNHINFLKYDEKDKKEKIKDEILQCQDLIKSITGYRTKLVRYPYGYSKEDAIEIAKETNYKVINWTFGIDWEKDITQENMLEQYLDNAKPGTIFLMHDLKKNTKIINILPTLIDELKNKGYKFVTVGKIINLNTGDK